MPYLGNVPSSFNVGTDNINNQAVTAPKLSATGGTSGQVLALDAGGNLVWTSDPAGQWVTSGSNIYYDTGNVGIGSPSATELLTVSSSSVSDTTLISLNCGAGIRQRFFPSGGTSKFNWQIAAQTNVDNAFEITPSSASGGTTFSTPALLIKSDGKVSVGSTAPSSIFQIESTNPIFTLERNNNNDNPAGAINFQTANNTVKWQIGTNQSIGVGFEINQGDASNNALYIDTNRNLIVGGTTAGNAGTVTINVGSPGGTVGGMQLWSATGNSSYVQFGDDTASASDHYRGYIGYQHAVDDLIFGTAAVERLRITDDSYVRLSANTGGLQFNGDTAAVNALDDYEEGSWTPSYSSSGISAVTYGSGRNGYYVKIGRMVTVWCNIMTNAVTVTSSSQSVYISGLPFTSTSDTESPSAISIGEAARWTSNPPNGGQIPSNSSNLFIYSTPYTTGTDPIFSLAGDMNTGSGNKNIARIVCTYMVNQ